MELRLDEAIPVLRRTPGCVRALLLDLPEAWIRSTEGPGTWSPFDIVGHLIHGERSNFLPRIEHILRHGDGVAFPPFEREAMFAASRGRSLAELLQTFDQLRAANIGRLSALKLTEQDLPRRGRHPDFGLVTLGQQ